MIRVSTTLTVSPDILHVLILLDAACCCTVAAEDDDVPHTDLDLALQ